MANPRPAGCVGRDDRGAGVVVFDSILYIFGAFPRAEVEWGGVGQRSLGVMDCTNCIPDMIP